MKILLAVILFLLMSLCLLMALLNLAMGGNEHRNMHSVMWRYFAAFVAGAAACAFGLVKLLT